jgi:hypothetical protein
MIKHVSALTEPTVYPHILHSLYLSVPPPFTKCAYEKHMISGFRHEVCEICALFFWDITQCMVVFQNNLSVLSSGVKHIGPIGCTETSVRNYQHTLCNIPTECRSHLKSGRYSLVHYYGIVQNLCVELKWHVRHNLKCWVFFMWLYWRDVGSQYRSMLDSWCFAFRSLWSPH